MNIEALRAKIASNQKLAVGVAVVGTLACIGAAIMNPAIFYRGYLLGFMFFMNLTLGFLKPVCARYPSWRYSFSYSFREFRICMNGPTLSMLPMITSCSKKLSI